MNPSLKSASNCSRIFGTRESTPQIGLWLKNPLPMILPHQFVTQRSDFWKKHARRSEPAYTGCLVVKSRGGQVAQHQRSLPASIAAILTKMAM